MIIKRICGAALCAVLISAFIHSEAIAESEPLAWLQDALFAPGLAIAGMIWPEGLHTGEGFESFPSIVHGANFAFWFLAMFVPIEAYAALRRSPDVEPSR